MKLRLLLSALLLAPPCVQAQAVTGTVRDGVTRQPVTGAMVRLMDGERWTGVLFLTAADGRFHLRAPGPGAYHLHVERIGFGETTVGPVELRPAATVAFDVRVAASPVRLQGLDVSAGRRQCSLPEDASGATQALWTEVRKALDAARWTEREAGLEFQVMQRTLQLDPRGRGIRDEQRGMATVFGGNSVRTLPPGELAEEGYVREEDEYVYYYGPDAAVLLSDEFLDTHCFSLVDGDAEAEGGEGDLVGLEFRPVGTRAPDITGVMWVDPVTARLDRVDFTYTNMGRRPGAEHAGGELRFAELSDGRWIVRDWAIRAPLLGLAREFIAGVLRERVVVRAVQEQGSEVISAVGAHVTWRGDVPWGGVAGLVWDSVSGGALADAEVVLGGRSRVTRTDAQGRFILEDVAPGTYWVTFHHPTTDTLDVDPPWRRVTVLPDSVTQVDLALPPPLGLLMLRCPGQRGLVGTVTEGPGGIPVGGAVINGVLAEGTDDAAPLSGVSDEQGRFLICVARGGLPASVEARVGERTSGPVEVQIPGDGYVVMELYVVPPEGEGAWPGGEVPG